MIGLHVLGVCPGFRLLFVFTPHLVLMRTHIHHICSTMIVEVVSCKFLWNSGNEKTEKEKILSQNFTRVPFPFNRDCRVATCGNDRQHFQGNSRSLEVGIKGSVSVTVSQFQFEDRCDKISVTIP